MTTLSKDASKLNVTVSSRSSEHLKQVIKSFAERAFSSSLSEKELAPYFQASLDALEIGEEFVEAAKIGFKAVFVLPPLPDGPGRAC